MDSSHAVQTTRIMEGHGECESNTPFAARSGDLCVFGWVEVWHSDSIKKVSGGVVSSGWTTSARSSIGNRSSACGDEVQPTGK